MQSVILTTIEAYVGTLKSLECLWGLQGGFTKHYCFLCLWDSCGTAQHYETKEWLTRNSYLN